MVRHVGTHFTCAVATHNNCFLFIDDVSSSNVALPNLDNIYNRYPKGWFFGVYVKATALSVLPISTKNVRIPHESEFNGKRKFEVNDYPLRSKLRKKANDKYYKKNKEKIQKLKEGYYEANKKKIQKHNKEYYQKNKEKLKKA